ncbi:Do family serine endopeptidase [Rhizobacter sp. LjRoot28]|uniref:Do family serine endopeptidase n=1 Tax=Rhizobacter sp. LjRoot28 TaxID=3342309 RepID=UPI003ECD2994
MASSPLTGRAASRLPIFRQALASLSAGLLLAASTAHAAPPVLQAQAQGKEVPQLADLVDMVGPAVVNIRTTERSADGPRMPFRRRAPSLQQSDEVPRGEGSGFIMSPDGYVMTNAHVIAGASEVYVTMTDKREFKARIIGADERTDVAVVKIDATGLPWMRVGDVNRLRVGEWVLAIGSPFGFDNTVTAGIVSAKQRETGSELPLLQTDVAVNPGNSGGPLINMRGEVVGVNSQIYSPVGSYVGISFAIPIDEAIRVSDQLKAGGRVVRGYLGIRPVEVSREAAEEYGLTKSRNRGAFVSQVIAGGPADKAGLQPGDIVLALNGKPVDGPVELRRALGAIKPGTPVVLQVNRRGKAMEIKATLAEMPSEAPAASTPERAEPAEPKGSSVGKAWGLTVQPLSDAERRATRGAGGVKVAGVTAGAEAVGMRPGDIIIAVGSTDVTDLKQFENALAPLDKNKRLSLTFLRGEWAQFVQVPPGK